MNILTKPAGFLMSVNGPLSPEQIGLTLPHEHIISTFGAESVRYPHYDLDRLLEGVLPYLEQLKSLGCCTILDCTAAYFGRHPELLRRVSQVSGLNILTNTGYYAAAGDRYVPPHAYTETAEQIALRWVHEWQDSIDETGIHPGFIKTAVDDGQISDIDRKLVQAAALTHLQTGLTIQTHTGDNPSAAQAILTILEKEGVHPSAWIWVHAHSLLYPAPLVSAAKKGAWISLDGVNSESAAHVLDLLQVLRRQDLLDHALLSHDGDSYCEGTFRPYHYILTDFLPLLHLKGFSEEEIYLLTTTNPAKAFSVQIRTAV